MEETAPSSSENKKTPKLKMPWIIALVILLILGGISLYYYNQYQQAKNQLQNPGASDAAQVKQLVQDVGKLIELPQGEQPTLATVSDVTKLQDQPFFIHAQNGDKVLLFSKANIAILYRPSQNKIIQVGTLNIVNNTTPTSGVNPSPTTALTPTILLTPTVTPAK